MMAVRLAIDGADRFVKSGHDGQFLFQAPQEPVVHPSLIHPVNLSGQIIGAVIKKPRPTKHVDAAVAVEQIPVGFGNDSHAVR